MYKTAATILAFLFLTVNGFSQDSIAIAYAKKIDADVLRQHLEVLASDSLEGRETGRPGQKKAASFIAKHFQSLGLKPVSHGGFYQHTSLSARANSGRNFEVNQKFFLFMKDYFYPAGGNDTVLVLDTIVFAGLGISSPGFDDYTDIDVRNKAVIFYQSQLISKPGKPNSRVSTPERLKTAAAKGAALAILITDSLDAFISDYNYYSKTFGDPGIPYVLISREMSNSFFPEYNERKFEKAEQKILRKSQPASFVSPSAALLSFVNNTDELRGENVLALLEGTDKKEEALILTAHYDHLGVRDSLIYYGADDNSSGTSAIMEIASTFAEAARNGIRPRRSILFMAVSGEEKGLLGSKYYVKYPVIPLDNTVANLNTDMIGRIDPKHDSLKMRDYVYIIGSDKLSTTLHKINELANTAFTKLELDYTFNRPDDPNRFYYRSDHYNFAKNNIPIIFYFNGSHADYHKPSDTIDKIQFDLLSKRTQLIFLTAWELANRDERIKVDVQSDMPNRRED